MGYQLKDPTEGMELNLRKDKPEEKSGVSGMLAGILGMGSAIGGMIPSLRKGPQTGQLEKMQRGQGAGASLARQTASRAAAAVTGASTAQPSSGRGGNLREGLRAADQIVQRGAQQAAITGARESLAATQMLRGNDLRRRDAFKTLGAGLGQGLAGIGGMLAAARDQGDQKVQQEETAQAISAQGGPVNATMQTGVAPAQGASAQMQATRTLEGAPPGPPGSLPGEAPYPQEDPRAGQEQYPGAENKGVAADLAQANTAQAQMDRSLEGLVTATEEKRQAADIYAATAATAIGPPSPAGSSPPGMMNPPEYVEDYLYNMAMNYDPRINQGMRPDLVAELLLDRGFVVDWERLGSVEPYEEPQQTRSQQPYKSPHARLGEKATAGASAAGEKIRGAFSGR